MSDGVQIKHLKAALLGVVLCAVVIAAGQLLGGPQRLVPYVSAPVVSVVGRVPTSGQGARDYRLLVEDGAYYAAFATDGAGEYGWSDNYASQAAADQTALAWCAQKGDASACRIVARIAPNEAIEIEGLPLSKTSALALADYATKPDAKAVALSETGAWGMAWGVGGAQQAAKRAVSNCQDNLVPAPNTDGPPLGTCRIVWIN